MTPRLLVLAVLLTPTLAAAESAAFGRRPTVVGDAIEHTLQVEMRLHTSSRQGADVIEEATNHVDRSQRRRVTAARTRDGRVVGATVQFFEATSTHNGESAPDVVAGKSYRCERGDDDTLTVLTDKGLMPSMKEYAQVVRAMETLGTASPLAEFLAGKTVEIGERLDLPADLASRALGFDKQFGTVDRFTLQLQELHEVDGRRVARFGATIEASAAGSGQMGLVVEGVFEIEEPTCRVVTAELAGPIAMSSLRGVGVVAHQMDGRGRMRMQIAARYRDATK